MSTYSGASFLVQPFVDKMEVLYSYFFIALPCGVTLGRDKTKFS